MLYSQSDLFFQGGCGKGTTLSPIGQVMTNK